MSRHGLNGIFYGLPRQIPGHLFFWGEVEGELLQHGVSLRMFPTLENKVLFMMAPTLVRVELEDVVQEKNKIQSK